MNEQKPQVPLARPEWHHEDYFREKFKDVTVLICQRKTRDLIQLCLTSILNHYPEINVLVVDGHSEDDSVEWLRFMSAKHSNVKLWERPEGRNSHGETMHEAMSMIETKYVLLMDSDTIVRRGGFVEGMLHQLHAPFTFQDDLKRPYATGSLMLVTLSGEGCGDPKGEADVLRYAHPSCSMYDVEIYKTLQPFTDHGAPCALNNIDAQSKEYAIEYFPVDKYVQHLCGASWQEIPTVWNDDADVQIRPLVTFIHRYDPGLDEDSFYHFEKQNEKDFNVIPIAGLRTQKTVSTYDRGVISISNYIYDIRLKVNGHYVCELVDENLSDDFISRLRAVVINNPTENELVCDGHLIIKRKHWQKYYSIK